MKSEEIAKLAGVSRSTVSRVINNYKNVPANTREKVMKIIEQYNYQPNTSARVLAGKRTDTIGLFIVSTSDRNNSNRIYQNNYFAPFVDAVVDRCNYSGYYVLVHTLYTEKDYLRIKQTFSQKRIDAGIIVGTEKNSFLMENLLGSSYPIALIDYDAEELSGVKPDTLNIAVINCADYDGTVEAVEYLIELGHKDIGIIAGRMSTRSGRLRLEAFEHTLMKHNLPLNKNFIIKGEFIKSRTYKEIKRLVGTGKLPTALFAANDDMALAAMEVFKEEGVRIPEDISIIGFDDVPVSAQIKPALSTIQMPVYNMADTAVRSLIESIEHEGTVSFRNYTLPARLVIRESCGKPR